MSEKNASTGSRPPVAVIVLALLLGVEALAGGALLAGGVWFAAGAGSLSGSPGEQVRALGILIGSVIIAVGCVLLGLAIAALRLLRRRARSAVAVTVTGNLVLASVAFVARNQVTRMTAQFALVVVLVALAALAPPRRPWFARR